MVCQKNLHSSWFPVFFKCNLNCTKVHHEIAFSSFLRDYFIHSEFPLLASAAQDERRFVFKDGERERASPPAPPLNTTFAAWGSSLERDARYPRMRAEWALHA